MVNTPKMAFILNSDSFIMQARSQEGMGAVAPPPPQNGRF